MTPTCNASVAASPTMRLSWLPSEALCRLAGGPASAILFEEPTLCSTRTKLTSPSYHVERPRASLNCAAKDQMALARALMTTPQLVALRVAVRGGR